MSSKSSIINAMTVDVEEYFQVSAFESTISRQDWHNQPARIERNVHRILDIFNQAQVKATFFVLWWIAKRYPQLITRMVAEGHEIASHGCDHKRVTELDKATFSEDVSTSRQQLEDLSGVAVIGYRAPSYSIGRDNLWALDVLAEQGYRYSSSIYPIKHDLYGMPEAPRFAFQYGKQDKILEIPVTTVKLAGKNLPCGGGGYFRLFPYALSQKLMQRVNRKDQQACVFYFHPWEIDPQQPKQPNISFKTKFRHYHNLDKVESRLHKLLENFNWTRMDACFLNNTAYPQFELAQP